MSTARTQFLRYAATKRRLYHSISKHSTLQITSLKGDTVKQSIKVVFSSITSCLFKSEQKQERGNEWRKHTFFHCCEFLQDFLRSDMSDIDRSPLRDF